MAKNIIALFLSLLTIPVCAFSQDTLRVLDELVISTERPSPFQPLVRVVAVIQAPEIERAAVQNIQDLLRYIQGVDIRSRGGEGVQADLSVMGGTFDQTMVMINGINFSDPQTGHHSLNIPVDISQIERIEILHGPGAWSGGTIAYSGAINIITKSGAQSSIDATLAGGENGYLRSGGNISFNNFGKSTKRDVKNKISGIAGGGYTKSDGYTSNTDFENGSLYAFFRGEGSRGKSVEIQAGFQNKSFGANSFYSVRFPEQYERTRVFLSSVRFKIERERWNINATIYQRRHWDRFELFRYDFPDSYKGHNYHQNDIAGASFQIARRWKNAGSTAAGAEYRYEHIYSNALGDPLLNPKDVPFEDGIEYTKSKGRSIKSAYLRHILQLNRVRFTAGVIFAQNRVTGGAAASYQPTPNSEFNIWINKSYRNPTFTDLYYKSPTQSGNINLRPEDALSFQGGYRYYKEGIKISASIFFRRGYRIIDWLRESNSDEWKSDNITNINSAGADFMAVLSPKNSLITQAGVAYSYITVQKQTNNLHSLYATDYLRHKARLFISHKIIAKLDGSWELNFRDRAGTYTNENNIETDYKPFALLDIKLRWRESNFTLFAEATNLLNESYLDLGNIEQPGRWIKGGIMISLTTNNKNR